MQVIYLKPSEIKPYERNNRKHPDSQIEKLAAQIKAHGWDVPIVVDKDYVIVKGHGRLRAAKKLKLKQVPVIVRDDLTPEQCKAARIADNRLSEIAEIDVEALQMELDDLKEINFDLELTAFDEWSAVKLPTFEPDLPDEDSKEKEHGKLVLRVEFEDAEEMQALFFELRDRGLAVKI
ncbi:MAG: ParB/Srx family N-terminal domain-containing protein [Myxococcaceae bacterium]